MKNLLLICVLCGTPFFLLSQNIQQFVPAQANFVLSVQSQNLQKKVSFTDIQQLEFYDMMLEQMTRGMSPEIKKDVFTLFTTPSQLGLDLNKNFTLFAKLDETGQFFGLVFHLKDPSIWEEAVLKTIDRDVKDYEKTALAKDVVLIDLNQSASIGWNGNIGIITGGKLQIDFSETWDYTDEDWELWEKQQAIAMHEWGKSLVQKSFDASLAGNADFQNALSSQPSDIHLWMDYEAILESSMGTIMGRMGGMGPGSAMGGMGALQSVLNLYKDMKISMHVGFNEGEVDVINQLYASEQMLDLYRDAMKNKSNKDLVKYLPEESTLGYMAFNYNIENTVEGFKSILRDVMKDMPEKGPLALGSMDLLELVIDEEALYGLFKGDLVLAMTGITESEQTVITYEYDEDFNASEVEKTVTKKVPTFTMMASYGDRENLMKLINIGVQTSTLVPNQNHYLVAIPDMPVDLYLALHDDILFLTNDKKFMEVRLPQNGYSKADRLSKEHCKRLKKNSQVIYWDIAKTIGMAEDFGMPVPPDAQAMLEQTQSKVGSLIVTAPKKVGDSIDSKFTLQMGSKDENVLLQVFKMIDELAVGMMGGEKS